MTKTTLTIKRLSTMFIAGILLGAVAVFSPTQPVYAPAAVLFTILDNNTGGDCEGEEIGKWNNKTKTCRLTIDLTIPVHIQDDSITLNCNNHLLDGGGTGVSGIVVINESFVTIKNCHVTGFTNGIFLQFADNNTIKSNHLFENSAKGLRLNDSDENDVLGNHAHNNGDDGIKISPDSDNNKIHGNTANDNDRDGIRLSLADGNSIDGNTANGNNFGIFLVNSNDNTLNENTANGNIEHGISLKGSTNNILDGNTANDNTVNGIYLGALSDFNIIIGNTADENNRSGIELSDSDFNDINGNTLKENVEWGLTLIGSNNNTLNGNTANENDGEGLFLMGGSNENKIIGNSFLFNGDGGSIISSDENELLENKFNNNGGFGIGFVNSFLNIIEDNEAKNNDVLGFFDDSIDGGTSGTANTYIDNKCVANGQDKDDGSDPDNLCSPQN